MSSWSAVSKSDFVKGTSEEADIVKWTFKDGTELEVKQDEHSVGVAQYHLQMHMTEIITVSQPLHHLQRGHFAAAALVQQRREHHPPLRHH